MPPLEQPEVRAWWELAQTDLRVARSVAELEPPAWGIVCFLAQQAGEKALKAVLEARELTVPRSHDLTTLLDGLPQTLVPEPLLDDAIRLSDYGVKPRYPSPSFAATADEAQAALAAAQRVLHWAEDLLWRAVTPLK